MASRFGLLRVMKHYRHDVGTVGRLACLVEGVLDLVRRELRLHGAGTQQDQNEASLNGPIDRGRNFLHPIGARSKGSVDPHTVVVGDQGLLNPARVGLVGASVRQKHRHTLAEPIYTIDLRLDCGA